jgi:hypothetical protein
MEKYRIPRKIKKKFKGNIWLYPADEKGNSLVASPKRSQEDYNAVKNGIAKPMVDFKRIKENRAAYKEKMDAEIFVDDSDLKNYVDEIFAEQYRFSSYNTLIRAKNNPKAIITYYNFINAYNLYKNGEESFGNICCASVDYAKDLLKKKRK